MKVLVTGGAGFIGSHVADAHVARGDEVVVLDNLSSGRRENVPADAEFVELDIRDRDAARLIRDRGFDLVSHHAAQLDVRVSVADPRLDASVNIDGLLNLLEAAREAEVEKVLFVSSGGVVYGEPERRPTPETSPKLPESPYGVTKLAGEQYLYYYHRVHGIEYAALRYSNVYGPRQDPHGEAGVVAIFSTRLLLGQPLPVYGDGQQTRDYVFVRDVVAANLLLADAPLARARAIDDRAFNVGTGVESSVNRLASVLSAAAGQPAEVTHADPRPGELRHSSLDASKLRKLGWEPKVGLEEGLGETFRWIAAERGKAPPSG
ncbi:MAG TPA: NAD-dependent epimerase/dehydratase family protein [Longimicrobiaceae bacterium]|nr:NAD-dependent epimerase/dehydratase family protein [Longimicrobiaceae bacterium]